MINYKTVGILVTYNPDLAHFYKVLRSLCEQLSTVIIIDNSSIDAMSISAESAVYNNIELACLTKNIGLAAAQNIGIKMASDLNATHIVLFDQDSLIEQGFINGLLEAEAALLVAGKNVGAVGPLFCDPSSNVVYPATVYSGPFIKRVPLDKPNIEVEATFIIASGCLIRMDTLKKIGLMNDELFIDYIDVDWSLRAKRSGYNSYITSRAKMAHTIGDTRVNLLGRTISVHSPLRRYYLIRNSFFMLRQSYVPFGYKLREVIFNLLRFMTGLTFSIDRKKYLYYAFWGMRDGINGIFGPCKHQLPGKL